MRGEFLEVDSPTRVVFSWGFTEPEIGVPPGSTTVEVTLRVVGSGTRVQLVHRDLPPAEVENHSQGWTEMLDRLARAVVISRAGPAATKAADRHRTFQTSTTEQP